jgi:hypothetical protein
MAHVESLHTINRKVRKHIKAVLNYLPDSFYIRDQILEGERIAPVVVEGPSKSWLLLGYSEDIPTEGELQKLIQFNQTQLDAGGYPLKYLAITKNGDDLFSSSSDCKYLRHISLEEFRKDGQKIIIDQLTEVSRVQYEQIKCGLIKEANIVSQCTTRASIKNRDTTAQLEKFFLNYDQELATRLDIVEDPEDDEHENENEKEGFPVRLINGVAGSGKTLILINRAILYCKKYPERKVLLLVHNKPVTEDIKYRIKSWIGMPSNLTIQTLHAFALGQKNAIGRRVKPLFGGKDLNDHRSFLFNNINPSFKSLTLDPEKLWSEMEYINDHLIKDEDAYLEYDRIGRGFGLKKGGEQRRLIWELYSQGMCRMSSVSGYLPSLYIRELCLMEDKHGFNKYDHILLDEAQFFTPSWLQLVRESLTEHGSIFMCADPNQGFLKSRLSWKSVGFNVRGRTRKLAYSYRTTYEILSAANQLLESLNEDSDDFVRPDFDNMERGDKPQVIYSDSDSDEQKRFLNELKTCVQNDQIPLNQIIVLCNENISPWNMKSAIERVLGRDTVVNCNARYEVENNLGSRIRLMNVNSCTGMEAGMVFVLGIGCLLNKAKNIELQAEEQQQMQHESIRKLYVAMTRAGQKLVLFSTENLPEEMNDLIDKA